MLFLNSFKLMLRDQDQNNIGPFYFSKILKMIFCFLYMTVMVTQPLYRKTILSIPGPISTHFTRAGAALFSSPWWDYCLDSPSNPGYYKKKKPHSSDVQAYLTSFAQNDCVLVGNRTFNKVWVCALERHFCCSFFRLCVCVVLTTFNAFQKSFNLNSHLNDCV